MHHQHPRWRTDCTQLAAGTNDHGPRSGLGQQCNLRANRPGLALPAVVPDRFSRHVAVWSTSANLDARMMIASFQMAINRRQHPASIMIYSDRRAQYASDDFRQLLARHGLVT